MCIGKKMEKNWTGCFGPIVGNAELDFLLLMGSLKSINQSYIKKKIDYEKFQAHRYRENSAINPMYPSHNFNSVAS